MYRAIAHVESCNRIVSGLIVVIRTNDHHGERHDLGLAINSSMGVARQVAYAKLAELCRACGKEAIIDTSELFNIDFIIEYNNERILQIAPLHVTVERVAARKSFWQRLWGR